VAALRLSQVPAEAGEGGGEAAAVASARQAARAGVHASVAGVLCWRYAQLLWVMPNRGACGAGSQGWRRAVRVGPGAG
jgi:hypothetical protein